MSKAEARRVNIYSPVTRFRVWPVPPGSYRLMFVVLSCQGHSQGCRRDRNLSEGSQRPAWQQPGHELTRFGSESWSWLWCQVTAAPTAPTQHLQPSQQLWEGGREALMSSQKLVEQRFSLTSSGVREGGGK